MKRKDALDWMKRVAQEMARERRAGGRRCPDCIAKLRWLARRVRGV